MNETNEEHTHVVSTRFEFGSLIQRLKADRLIKRFKQDATFLPSTTQLRLAFNLDHEDSIHPYWNHLVRGLSGSHEILTQEYIQALANYLVDRMTEIEAETGKFGNIVEVGAGDGQLAFFLNQALKNKSKITIIPTDAKIGWIEESKFEVEKADVLAALSKHVPSIVICSWMPEGIDWTDAFANTPGVREYILIGNPDHTGKHNYSWENHSLLEFRQVNLVDISSFQLARFLGTVRTDRERRTLDARGAIKYPSRTVAFRRL